MVMKSTPEERFWSYVDRKSPEECWEWTGCRFNTGYGMLGVGSKCRSTHRLSWELHFGPVPGGLWVLHRCDNRSCVNPAHLFLGTARDNYHDSRAKGRHSAADRHGMRRHPERIRRGEQSNPARLTDAKVVAIRQRYKAGGISQSALAREYGVTQSTIWNILFRKTWKHL